MVVCQAFPDEVFAAVRDDRLCWEYNLPGIQNCLVSYDCHLRLIVAKRLYSKYKFKEDDPNAPNVNLTTEKRLIKDNVFRLPFV